MHAEAFPIPIPFPHPFRCVQLQLINREIHHK